MNSYFLPRPSLTGAILWQRRRSAVGITFSMRVLTWTVFIPIAILCSGGVLPLPILAPLARFWWQILAGVLAVNLAAAAWVSISRDGVRTRHLLYPFGRVGYAPLGGHFSGETSDPEDDSWEIVDCWNSYEVEGRDSPLGFPSLRPVATAKWLNAQLYRIQAQQLPTTSVAVRPPRQRG